MKDDAAKARNRQYMRDYMRQRRTNNREAYNAYMRDYMRGRGHGRDIDLVFAQMWVEQDGKCYLCDGLLKKDEAVIEHDHRCCPAGRSCSRCRRGLACNNCNSVAGFAGDDPALLRLIADRLEAAITRVSSNLDTNLTRQIVLFGDGMP